MKKTLIKYGNPIFYAFLCYGMTAISSSIHITRFLLP